MQESELLYLLGKIKSNDLVSLKDKNLDKKILLALNLKSPKIGLILGIFFGIFGVDRFYKGDIFLGTIKLISFFISNISFFFIVTSPLTIFIYIMPDAPLELKQIVAKMFLFCIAIWLIFAIWVFIDLFLVYRGIKKDNFKKILMLECQVSYLKNYLNNEQILSLKDKNLNNYALFMLNLKSFKTALILGIFFGGFGVDRFYKGNILLGIIRLLGGLISYFLFFFYTRLRYVLYAWCYN